MLKNYKFWFKAGSWGLVVTGLLHAMSFLNEPAPANETERQLFDLFSNYQFDLMGAHRTMSDLMNFFSLNLSLSLFFVAWLNLFFAGYFMPSPHERKFLLANAIFWTILLVPLYAWTFVIPIACLTICWVFFVLAVIVHRK